MKTINFTRDEQFNNQASYLNSLSELFTIVPDENKPSKERKIAHEFTTTDHKGRKAPCYLSSFTSIRDHREDAQLNFRWFKLTPTKKLLDWIQANMLLIDYDTLGVEFIIRADGSVLATVHYNVIIGSHWLFVVPVEQFISELQIDTSKVYSR